MLYNVENLIKERDGLRAEIERLKDQVEVLREGQTEAISSLRADYDMVQERLFESQAETAEAVRQLHEANGLVESQEKTIDGYDNYIAKIDAACHQHLLVQHDEEFDDVSHKTNPDSRFVHYLLSILRGER